MALDNRSKFLNALEERIRVTQSEFNHGGYVALKVLFEQLFPPYELTVGDYDHGNEKLDHAIGYDREVMDKHPIIVGFNQWLIDYLKNAYLEDKPLPKLSYFWEKLEELNIHPRLKIVAAFIFYPVYQKAKIDFRKRDFFKELSKAHDEGGDKGLLEKLAKMKKEHGQDKTQPRGDEPLGGVRPDPGGHSDDRGHSGPDSSGESPDDERFQSN